MPAIPRGNSDSAKSGAAAGVAFIRAKGDPNRGVRVHHPDADHDWMLVTEEGVAATPAAARIPGAGAANYLTVTLPDELQRHDASQNDFGIAVALAEVVTAPAVAAHVDIGTSHNLQSGITVTHLTAGAGGNDFTINFTYGWNHAPSAVYESATRLVVTLDTGHSVQSLISAINNARHNGSQLVRASGWNGGQNGNIVVLRGGDHRLQGGLDARVASRDPLAFEFDARDNVEEFLLTLAATDTLAEVQTVIEAFRYAGHQPFAGQVALTGDGTDTVAASAIPGSAGAASAIAIDFAGGVDHESVGAPVDAAAKTVTVTWVSDFHWLADLVGAYDSGVVISAVPGTHLHASPTPAGDDIPFDFDAEIASDKTTIGVEPIGSATFDFTAANTLTAHSGAGIAKPGEIGATDVWFAHVGGQEDNVGLQLTLFLPVEIPDTGALGATTDDNSLGVYVGGFFMHFAWVGGHLAAGCDDTSADPMPLTLYRPTGVGARGPRGRPGADSEARSITVQYWQDANRTSGIPNAADSVEADAARLHPIRFDARDRPRTLHFAVPLADAIDLLSIEGLEQLAQFSEAVTATHRLYHSPRIRATGALSCLVRAVQHDD